jgi:hypothetical protein
MDIVFFLLLFFAAWIALGTLVAAGVALVLGRTTAFLTRHVREDRREVIRAARWLPFKCLLWIAVVFVSYWAVNIGVRHNTSLRGDTLTCQLPNGYAVAMIDWTDEGWLYDSRIRGFGVIEGLGDQQGSISGVRLMQVAGKYILGASDSHLDSHVGTDSDYVDEYFILDTLTRNRADFTSYDLLKKAAAQVRITLKLERIYDVYRRYRFTWFDVVIAFIAIAPPLAVGSLLLVRIVRLRKTMGVTALKGAT